MAHSPAHTASPSKPYQCPVCRKIYLHLFDHLCIVTDPCCHFGELLISDDPAGAALHVHAKPPSAPVYPPS